MSDPTVNPTSRDLAERLLAYEAVKADHSRVPPLPVARVVETLRYSLSKLAGEAGFRALLTRAVTLAKSQAPGLSTVQIQPDGSLQGFPDPTTDELAQAYIILVANLLGLLITFVGEPFTRTLVQDAWPDLLADNRSAEK